MRRENSSFDLVRSCLPLRAFSPIDGFRARCFSLRWIGGNDEYRPGGDCPNIEGSSSRGRLDGYGDNASWCKDSRIDGNSKPECDNESRLISGSG